MTESSRYFEDLYQTYAAEISDLLTDSEGKIVIHERLKKMRPEFESLLPLLEDNPEMGAVHFYSAFEFTDIALVRDAVCCDPESAEFPAWADLQKTLVVETWAEPLTETALSAGFGDRFLVIAASLEYLRSIDKSDAAFGEKEPTERDDAGDDDADGDAEDLADAGSEWLSDQGFEPIK